MKQYEIKKKTQNFKFGLIILIFILCFTTIAHSFVANSSTYTLGDMIQSNSEGINPKNISFQIDNQSHFFYEYYENPPNPNPTPFPNSTNWGSPVDATSNLKYEDGIYETTIAPSVLHKSAGTYQLFEFDILGENPSSGVFYIKLKNDGILPIISRDISIWNEVTSSYDQLGTFTGINTLYTISLTQTQLSNGKLDGKLYFTVDTTKGNNVGGIVLSTDYVKLELDSLSTYSFRSTQHYQQPVGAFESENYTGILRWLRSAKQQLIEGIIYTQVCITPSSIKTSIVSLLTGESNNTIKNCQFGCYNGGCILPQDSINLNYTLLIIFAIVVLIPTFLLYYTKKLNLFSLLYVINLLLIIVFTESYILGNILKINTSPVLKIIIIILSFILITLSIIWVIFRKGLKWYEE